MEGFQVFKLWVGFRLHFSGKMDVTVNKGRLSGKFETYLARKDYQKFESVARYFTDLKMVVRYLLANFLYGNEQCIWDMSSGVANYNLLLKRQRSLSVVVENDLQTFTNRGILPSDSVEMVRMLTQNQVTIETIVILNKHLPITKDIRDLPIAQILNPLLDRIDYAGSFFKPNEKVQRVVDKWLKRE